MPGNRRGARVFITKVPQEFGPEQIRRYFERFGTTSDVYLPKVPEQHKHKGIAFVTYQSSAAAEQVVQQRLHMVENHELTVDMASPKPDRQAMPMGLGQPHFAAMQGPGYRPAEYPNAPQRPRGPPPGKKDDTSKRIFVTKIPQRVTEAHLKEYFAHFGDLEDFYMPKIFTNPSNHKGIAFVSFVDPKNCDMVLAKKQVPIGEDMVVVDRAVAREDGNMQGARQPECCRLFVAQLDFAATEADLTDYFGQFGHVSEVFIPKRPEGPGSNRGFGFVTFSNVEDVKKTMAHGQHTINGRQVRLDYAEPEGHKRANGPAGYAPGPPGYPGGKGARGMSMPQQQPAPFYDMRQRPQPAYSGYQFPTPYAPDGYSNYGQAMPQGYAPPMQMQYQQSMSSQAAQAAYMQQHDPYHHHQQSTSGMHAYPTGYS